MQPGCIMMHHGSRLHDPEKYSARAKAAARPIAYSIPLIFFHFLSRPVLPA